MTKHLIAKALGTYINLIGHFRPDTATALAYRFFSRPRAGRLTENKLAPVLAKAEHETFALPNGDRFRTYRWPGNNTVIMLVHGWESNAARWEKMLPHLQQTGATIVALDAPAHGLSDGHEFSVPGYADAIHIAVQHYNPSAIIGHSMGGAATLYHQHRDRHPSVNKMVLLGAPSDLRVLVDHYTNLLGLNRRTKTRLEQYFKTRFNVVVDEFSGHRFGQTVDIGGLIAHDISDTVVAFAEAEKIAKGWTSARLLTTNRLGHSMHDDALYAEIADFLR